MYEYCSNVTSEKVIQSIICNSFIVLINLNFQTSFIILFNLLKKENFMIIVVSSLLQKESHFDNPKLHKHFYSCSKAGVNVEKFL
jgi:hypothetical protein